MFFKCENISFKYSQNLILNNVSLELKKGQFTGLVGDNGSGKSTLMKVLSGIYEPFEGKISIYEEELNLQNRLKIGYIFQNPENQIVGVTVEEDVAFGLENIGYPEDLMVKRIDWALDITGLKDMRKRDPNTLSGGQKQRLAISSILAMNPEIIFMDEPTTMLDPVGRKEVYGVIKTLISMGKTIVIASHHSEDLNEVERIIALKKGNLVFDGNREEFYNKNVVINIEKPFEFRLKDHYNMDLKTLEKNLCQ